MTAITNHTIKPALHPRFARLRRNSMPNRPLRSVLLLTVLAAGTSAVQAQTSVPQQESGVSVSVTAAADPAQSQKGNMIQTRSAGNPLDAAFKRADTNGDGRLSRKEAEHFPMLSQRFDSVDSNGDAFLSREEFDRAIGN